MNFLSLFAIIVAILYALAIVHMWPSAKGDKQVTCALVVLCCLGWWNVCDAFFYVAETEAAAWFWLRLGALGWAGFIPVTSYYFLILTGDDTALFGTPPRKLLYWGPAAAIVVSLMLPGSYGLADELVPSGSGLGWAYRQSFTTFWPFLELLLLVVYLGGSMLRLYQRQGKDAADNVVALSHGFIALDSLSVAIGFVTIYIIPLFTTYLPPLSFLATFCFLAGYWLDLRDHDLAHIEVALDPKAVFDSSPNAIVVTDSSWNILYANPGALQMMGDTLLKGNHFFNCCLPGGQPVLTAFAVSANKRVSGLALTLSYRRTQVDCSLTRLNTRRGGHEVFVLALQDVTELQAAKARLAFLDTHDELTNLHNRAALHAELQRLTELYAQTGQDFAVVYLDLCNLAQINEHFGYAAGDAALRATAAALMAAAPEQDFLARLAGDEFVLLHHPGRYITLPQVSQNLADAVERIDCTGFAPGTTLKVAVGSCLYSAAGSHQQLYCQARRQCKGTGRQADVCPHSAP